MNTTRRHFIKVSAAATAVMSTQDIFAEEKVKPLRILILAAPDSPARFR